MLDAEEVMGVKKMEDYFKKHYNYNALVHTVLGVGIGILMTYPFVGEHPLRWGAAFVLAGVLGHLYPLSGGR